MNDVRLTLNAAIKDKVENRRMSEDEAPAFTISMFKTYDIKHRDLYAPKQELVSELWTDVQKRLVTDYESKAIGNEMVPNPLALLSALQFMVLNGGVRWDVHSISTTMWKQLFTTTFAPDIPLEERKAHINSLQSLAEKLHTPGVALPTSIKDKVGTGMSAEKVTVPSNINTNAASRVTTYLTHIGMLEWDADSRMYDVAPDIRARIENLQPVTPFKPRLVGGAPRYHAPITKRLTATVGPRIQRVVQVVSSIPLAYPSNAEPFKDLLIRMAKTRDDAISSALPAGGSIKPSISKNEIDMANNSIAELVNSTFYTPPVFDTRGRLYFRGSTSIQGGKHILRYLIQFKEPVPIDVNSDAFNYSLGSFFEAPGNTKSVIEAGRAYQKSTPSTPDERELKSYLLANKDTAVTYIDATASGFGIVAGAFNKKDLAKATNLSGHDYLDFHQTVTDHINETLGTSYKREFIKQINIPLIYGAGASTIARKLNVDEAAVKRIMDSIDSFTGVLTYKNLVRDSLKTQFKKDPKRVQKLQWTMPDGFVVDIQKTTRDEVRIGQNAVSKSSNFSVDETIKAVIPGIIHSIDAYIARETIRRAALQTPPIPVLTIHDAFGTYPGRITELRNIIQDVYQDIHNPANFKRTNEKSLFNDILRQLKIDHNAIEPLDYKTITNSHAFM